MSYATNRISEQIHRRADPGDRQQGRPGGFVRLSYVEKTRHVTHEGSFKSSCCYRRSCACVFARYGIGPCLRSATMTANERNGTLRRDTTTASTLRLVDEDVGEFALR